LKILLALATTAGCGTASAFAHDASATSDDPVLDFVAGDYVTLARDPDGGPVSGGTARITWTTDGVMLEQSQGNGLFRQRSRWRGRWR